MFYIKVALHVLILAEKIKNIALPVSAHPCVKCGRKGKKYL